MNPLYSSQESQPDPLAAIDMAAIGRAAYYERQTLRSLPSALISAAELAQEIGVELIHADEQECAPFITEGMFLGLLGVIEGAARHLETIAVDIVGDEDAGLPGLVETARKPTEGAGMNAAPCIVAHVPSHHRQESK